MRERLEELVPPLELCRRLKELGAPQESIFYWSRERRSDRHAVTMGRRIFEPADPEPNFAAYTTAELGRLLPGGIDRGGDHYWLETRTAKSAIVEGWYWCAYYVDEEEKYLYDIRDVEEWESLSEAAVRARMLIAVVEGGDLSFTR